MKTHKTNPKYHDKIRKQLDILNKHTRIVWDIKTNIELHNPKEEEEAEAKHKIQKDIYWALIMKAAPPIKESGLSFNIATMEIEVLDEYYYKHRFDSLDTIVELIQEGVLTSAKDAKESLDRINRK